MSPAETEILCVRCGKNWVPVEAPGVVCDDCLKKVAPASTSAIVALRAQQVAFTVAVDDLIALYRDFDQSGRKQIKTRLKAFYEKLQDLGALIGISRNSLDHLWKG